VAFGPPAYWSYNSGPILGALLDLSSVRDAGVPEDPDAILARAWQIADEGITYFRTDGGQALYEKNDPTCVDPRTGGVNADCPEFKGIFMRYLARLAYSDAGIDASSAQAFLAKNALTIWENRSADASVPSSCATQGLYGCADASGIILPLEWNSADAEPQAAMYQPAMTSALDGLIAGIPAPASARP